MRSIWNGTLRFGQIPIPVGLGPTKGDGEIALKTLHRECRNPVAMPPVCPVHGEVPAEELVKGWEVSPGEYVLLEPDELDTIRPEATRAIEIVCFVEQAAVTAPLVEKTYFLIPSDSPFGRKTYTLLAMALADVEAAAVCRFVGWGKERVCAVTPAHGRLLLLQTLAAADDVRDPAELEQAVATIAIDADELTLAAQLVDRKLVPFTAELLRSTQRAAMRELLDAKLADGELVTPEPAPTGPAGQNVTVPFDLQAALRASIKAAGPKRRSRQRATAPA